MSRVLSALPANYKPCGTLDISKNGLVAVGLTVVAAVSLVPIGWLVLMFLAVARPDAKSSDLRVGFPDIFVVLAILVGLIAFMVIAHEALHGLGFWAVTQERPSFGVRGLYAYAGAPNWYISAAQYLPIALAPLMVITLAGLALLLVTPRAVVPVIFLVIVLNASGAVGDIAVLLWLLTRAGSPIVRDSGEEITLYRLV